MADFPLVNAIAAGDATGTGVTEYVPLAGGSLGTTEGASQVLIQDSYTLSLLLVNCTSNASDNTTVIRTRKDAGNGAQSVSYAAAETGVKEDTVNTEAMADGEYWNYSVVNSGTGSFVRTVISSVITGDIFPYINSPSFGQAQSLTRYFSIAGQSLVTTESFVQYPVRAATVFSKFRTYASGNTGTAATNRFRIDAGDGNQVVSYAVSETGEKIDTVNTDSVSVGQLVNFSSITTSDTGTITWAVFQVLGDTLAVALIAGVSAVSSANGLSYIPVNGNNASATTEANAQTKTVEADVSHLYVGVSANTKDGATTYNLRKGGSSSSFSISFAAAETGTKEDTVNTDTLVRSDLVNYIRDTTASSSGSITTNLIASLFTPPAPPPDPTTIAAGIIVMWPSTAASIPGGWTRVTGLDSLYIKGTATGVNPNVTGGSANHSHTSQNHSHTINHGHTNAGTSGTASNAINARTTGSTVSAAPASHTHTDPAWPSATVNSANANPTTDNQGNEADNLVVIYLESDGTPTGIPIGALALFNSASLPTDWTLYTNSKNRFLKGAAAAGNGGGTNTGDAGHTHSVSHTHTSAHTHVAATSGVASGSAVTRRSGSVGTGHQHTHEVTGSSGNFGTSNTENLTTIAGTVEPPWTKLAVIENGAAIAEMSTGTILMWLGTLADIPTGWNLCNGTNGTPDLRNKFIKGVNDTSEIGNTGGAAGHSHTANSHDHSWAATSHTHPTAYAAADLVAEQNGAANAYSAPHNTEHAGTSSSATVATVGQTAPTVDNNADTQPPFRTVAYIQATFDLPSTAGITLTPTPIAVPVIFPNPAVALGAITLAPTPVIVPVVFPDPAVALTLAIAPTPLVVPVTLPDPAVALGALTLTPDPVVVPVVLPAPTVTLTLTLTPDPVLVPVILANPTITLGAITRTPDPIVVPVVLENPTVVLSLAISPSPVVVPAVLQNPSIALTLALAPTPVLVPVVFPDPSIQVDRLLTPDPVIVPIVLTTPAIAFGAITRTPDPILVPVVLETPSVALTLALTPDPLLVPVVLQTPTVALTLSITPSPIVVPVLLTTPSVVLGALTLTPTPIVVPVLLISPTITVDRTLTPSPVVVPIVLTTPTLVSTLTITPTPVVVPIVLTTPSVALTLTLSPSPVVVPILLPTPTVTAGAIIVSPDPLLVPVVLTTPAVVLGAIIISPSPVVVPIVLETPTVSLSYQLAPTPVVVPISFPTPAITLGALTTTPSPIVVPIVLQAPTVGLTYSLAPSPLLVPIAFPTPSVALNLTITPTPIDVPVVFPTVSVIIGGATIFPDPVIVPLVFPDPTVTLALGLIPSPLLVPVVFPPVTITVQQIIAPDPIVVLVVLKDPFIFWRATAQCSDSLAYYASCNDELTFTLAIIDVVLYNASIEDALTDSASCADVLLTVAVGMDVVP